MKSSMIHTRNLEDINMSISKEELVSLAEKGYYEFEDRLETEKSSKIFTEYFKNLTDLGNLPDSWDLTMKDIHEINKNLCMEIRLTAKEYQLEDSFEFAKACIAHKII